MIVQIYSVQTPEEGVDLVNVGVDNIGVVASFNGQPGEVSYATAKKIFEAVGSRATKVALTVDSNLEHIAEMTNFLHPDILHLSGELDQVPPAAVAELHKLLPGQKIMQAIPVQDHSAIERAKAYQEIVDYLILDSKSKEIFGVGAAGVTHDWNIDKEIVRQSPIPVILAGGLSPDNVAEAIHFVNPWGVDSLTKTNDISSKGIPRKDIHLVRKFVTAARLAASSRI